MLDSPPKAVPSSSASSSSAPIHKPSAAPAASTAATASTGTPSSLEVALGPHSFSQKQEGANFFLEHMKTRYPNIWHSVYNSPLFCAKSGVVGWHPKTSKPMEWHFLCRKLTAYLWSVDKKLVKCSAKKFPKDLWQRYVDELLPVTGKDPRFILLRLYDYANLAPPGVTSRP